MPPRFKCAIESATKRRPGATLLCLRRNGRSDKATEGMSLHPSTRKCTATIIDTTVLPKGIPFLTRSDEKKRFADERDPTGVMAMNLLTLIRRHTPMEDPLPPPLQRPPVPRPQHIRLARDEQQQHLPLRGPPFLLPIPNHPHPMKNHRR